jgi:hypothetical protein
MQQPAFPDLLSAWEAGVAAEAPVGRAIALLALARPQDRAAGLGEVAIGSRDRALFDLREALFGPHVNGVVRCVACGEQLEFACTVSDLMAPAPADRPVGLERDGYSLTLRAPNSADLQAALAAPQDAAEAVLLARCVLEARRDGKPMESSALPPHVAEAAARRLAEADPQAEVGLDLDCPSCGRKSAERFDIASFLWVELDALVGQLIGEVHELAWAYGWSERDILALPPGRRRRYLALLRA